MCCCLSQVSSTQLQQQTATTSSLPNTRLQRRHFLSSLPFINQLINHFKLSRLLFEFCVKERLPHEYLCSVALILPALLCFQIQRVKERERERLAIQQLACQQLACQQQARQQRARQQRARLSHFRHISRCLLSTEKKGKTQTKTKRQIRVQLAN